MFDRLLSCLEDLEKLGLKSTHVKKLIHSDAIFRKRVGRYRVLFTLDVRTIEVWIIDIGERYKARLFEMDEIHSPTFVGKT